MSPPMTALVEREAAFLVALAEHGFSADIGEYLMQGDPTRGVPPGGLAKALTAALRQPGAEYRRGVEAGRTAARDLRNAMHRSLRSGHKQAHMNYGPLTVCLDAIDRALSDSIPDTKGGRDGE